MTPIRFKQGYKYQLEGEFHIQTAVLPQHAIATDYLELSLAGTLCMAKGYAWDGPSGPTFDKHSFMRASLVHDALYQLMRHDLLDRDHYRLPADQLMKRLCLEDGMNPLWAEVVYIAVRWFGGPHASREQRKPLLFAP